MVIKLSQLAGLSYLGTRAKEYVDSQISNLAGLTSDSILQLQNQISDISHSLGIEYGKAITESWESLSDRISRGDFSGIHVGDYKRIALTTGEPVLMEVAGIDTYYNYMNGAVPHHVDFISSECLSTPMVFSTTNVYGGTANKPVWNDSTLQSKLNNISTGVLSTLPSDLKPFIKVKKMHMYVRKKGSTSISEMNIFSMGLLWVPSEMEITGRHYYGDDEYGIAGDVQYPIFRDPLRFEYPYLKKNGLGGDDLDTGWWTCTPVKGSFEKVCVVNSWGLWTDFCTDSKYVPLCFRI